MIKAVSWKGYFRNQSIGMAELFGTGKRFEFPLLAFDFGGAVGLFACKDTPDVGVRCGESDGRAGLIDG